MHKFPCELIQEIFAHLVDIPAPPSFVPAACHEHAVPCVEVIYSPNERYAKRNLALCSSVCRWWNANARPLLFRTLALRFSPTSSGARTLHDIALWLRTSGIRSFVQEFRLILTQPDDDTQTGKKWGDHLNYDATLLSYVLFSFGSLCTLKLVDVRLDHFSQYRSSLLDSRLPKQPTLHLHSFHYIFNKCSPFCGVQSLPDLLYLLTWLGYVKELRIGYVPLILREDHSLKSLVATPRRLQISEGSVEGDLSIHLLVRGLQDSLRVNLSSLRSLSVLLNVLGEGDLHKVPSLLELISPHATNLHINLIGLLNLSRGGIYSIPDSYTAFDLSSLTSLQTLRIDIPVGHIQLTSLSYEQLVWWYLANIFMTASALPLQQVTLQLRFCGATTMPGLVAGCSTSMADIDAIMCRIPSLRRFRLLKAGSPPNSMEYALVKDAFEDLRTRGVLEYGRSEDMAEAEHMCAIVPSLQMRPW